MLQSLKMVNQPTYTMHHEPGENGSCHQQAGSLAFMCSRKWPYLMVLDLTSLKLTAAALSQLVPGHWGNLSA